MLSFTPPPGSDVTPPQAAGYLSATGRPALMADRSVKALIKELNDSHGTSRQPMTIGTKLMLGHSIHDIIPRL